MAFQAAVGNIKYIFLSVMFISFGLIMTSIAGPVPIRGMACAAIVVRSTVIGWEAMGDRSSSPRIGGVALRALSIEVARRFIAAVAGYAIPSG